MVNRIHSRYRPMQYISVKEKVIEVKSSMQLVERSDTSCSVYPRAAFITVFALHSEAVI